MKRPGLIVLAILTGVSPAWAAEPQRTFPSDEINKGPQKQRPHTLSCWEGGVRVLRVKNVTIRHYIAVV